MSLSLVVVHRRFRIRPEAGWLVVVRLLRSDVSEQMLAIPARGSEVIDGAEKRETTTRSRWASGGQKRTEEDGRVSRASSRRTAAEGKGKRGLEQGSEGEIGQL